MPMYIANALSLSMLDREQQATQYYRVPRPITYAEVLDRLASCKKYGAEIISCIGHADTAALFSNLLGQELPVNRISVKLIDGTGLIVGQYVGPRLAEGATNLPAGATIEWWAI